jgi:nicotinate dehydrogenase subunit A
MGANISMTAYTLRVNGKAHKLDTDPAKPLIYVLRGELGLTGPKIGCALEQCAACAVLVDGEHTLSCNRAASEFEGAEITTIEGLAEDAIGARIQNAFMAENAAQCGYCTPGIMRRPMMPILPKPSPIIFADAAPTTGFCAPPAPLS